MGYTCAVCGEAHDDLPDIGFRWPDPYFGIPEGEREDRIRATSDICVIDEEDYFIRGVILLPVHEREEPLGLGVWVSQKRENFQTYIDNFDTPDIGPFFGWLSNRLPFYAIDTWATKAMAHFQGNGQRPLICPEPDNPIYQDHVRGISLHRAWEMVNWGKSSAAGT
jgi:hypothetical protein